MVKKYLNKAKNLIVKFKNTGFVHLLGSSVINKVLAFVSSFVLVRLIPKADYGVYANADNILGLFCIFEGLGMTSTWLQYGCTRKDKEKEERRKDQPYQKQQGIRQVPCGETTERGDRQRQRSHQGHCKTGWHQDKDCC